MLGLFKSYKVTDAAHSTYQIYIINAVGNTDSVTTSTPMTTTPMTTTTTPAGPCEDRVNCTDLNDILDICKPVTEQTKTMCPRFCGLCGEKMH